MQADPVTLRNLILTPLAESHGLAYELESLAPTRSDAALAFAFVSCGADLLVAVLTDPDWFPAKNRRTKRRAMQAAYLGLLSDSGRTAAIYLTHAMALDLEWRLGMAGETYSAESHTRFRELIQEQYPLGANELAALEQLPREYRVLQTHEVPEPVRIGAESGTGYHRALMDPGFSEFDNVDDDEHLVTIQRSYAGRFLQHTAILDALRIVVGAEKFEKLRPGLLLVGEPEIDGLIFESGLQAGWNVASETWRQHALRAIREDPEPDALPDDVTEYLRRRAFVFLENPDAPMPPAAADLSSSYASTVTVTQDDWDCVTDSLVIGYCLRRAEEELNDHHVLSDDARAMVLREGTDKHDVLALAQHTVANTMPDFYSRGPSAWQTIRTWAATEALARCQQRHALEGDHDVARPGVGTEECSEAFEFGYTLRAALTGLYGEDC